MSKITHIECRRWRDKTYGNTYHKCTIYCDDGSVIESQVKYGYGDHCLHTAIEVAKLASDAYKVAPYSLFLREKNITYSIIDVSRKKDL